MSPTLRPPEEVRLKRTAMSTRELRRAEVLGRVKGQALRLVDAAKMLELSYRQAKRLWRRYREEGAKGRQQRNNGVHQDRLVKKLRGQGIQSYEAANEYLEAKYLAEHNRRFARAAARAENYHVRAPSAAKLREVFRLETERWISNDWVVQYRGIFCSSSRRKSVMGRRKPRRWCASGRMARWRYVPRRTNGVRRSGRSTSSSPGSAR